MARVEFKYSAQAELIGAGKSIERVDISKGKGALRKLQSGERYQVRLTIDARFWWTDTDNEMLKRIRQGKTFEVTWTADTDDGAARLVGSPKKDESDRQLIPGGECDLEASDRGDGVIATVTCLMPQVFADDIKDSQVFVCDLVVAPAKQPEVVVPKIPRDLTSTSAYFGEPGKKGLDSANLPTTSLRDLDNWVKGIQKHEALYRVIADGMVPIHLEGNTSKSGSKAYNEKLAKQRIDAVARKLRSSIGSSKLAFVQAPKAQSKFETEHDYRVDVFFVKEVAESAMLAVAVANSTSR